MVISSPCSFEQRQRQLYAESKRCLQCNDDFNSIMSGGLYWHVRIPLQPELENILAAPDQYLAYSNRIFVSSSNSTVGVSNGMVLKRYNFRNIRMLMKDLFRGSKARDAYRKAYHLELAGIPTARPIATADRRIARFLTRSYFIMEEIPGGLHMGKWRRGDNATAAMKAVAELIARLHHEGFRHRDLKSSNILFDPEQRFYLIDLEGLQYVRSVSQHLVHSDLTKLESSLAKLPQFTDADRAGLRHYYGEYRKCLANGK